jgi:hypothetical protein
MEELSAMNTSLLAGAERWRAIYTNPPPTLVTNRFDDANGGLSRIGVRW